MKRQAAVFNNNTLAGFLTEELGRYTFRYEDAYFNDSGSAAISLTLPKTQQLYVAPHLFPFFAGLLAEGTNRSFQTRAYRLDERDDFGLLLAAAGLNTIGAITVRPL